GGSASTSNSTVSGSAATTPWQPSGATITVFASGWPGHTKVPSGMFGDTAEPSSTFHTTLTGEVGNRAKKETLLRRSPLSGENSTFATLPCLRALPRYRGYSTVHSVGFGCDEARAW